jgi:hypothetical protein
MAKGGIKIVRVNFDQRALSPRKGVYAWHQTDYWVKHLAKKGIKTFPIIYATPKWIAKNYTRPPLDSATHRRDWRRLLQQQVKRYGPNGTFWTANPTLPYEPIHYWQIWNEPNLPCCFAPHPNPGRYRQLLELSAKAIRNVDPHAKIVTGGMPLGNSPGAIPNFKFLRKLYHDHGRRWFDVVALHPYAPTVGGVEQITALFRRVTRSEHDGRVPIWITEIGWGSGHSKNSPLAVGRQRQARNLRATFIMARRDRTKLGIGRLFWFNWQDPHIKTTTCVWCYTSGLFNKKGNPKPSWRVFKKFAR